MPMNVLDPVKGLEAEIFAAEENRRNGSVSGRFCIFQLRLVTNGYLDERTFIEILLQTLCDAGPHSRRIPTKLFWIKFFIKSVTDVHRSYHC